MDKVFLVKGFNTDYTDNYLVGEVFSNLNSAKDYIERLTKECYENLDENFNDSQIVEKTEIFRHSTGIVMRRTISVSLNPNDAEKMKRFKYNMLGQLQIDDSCYKNLELKSDYLLFNALDLSIIIKWVND